MRTLQRVVRRAGLPVEYSKGFNPHMNVSIAQPLSVGMYSDGEYMDVMLTEEVDEQLINEKLNENAPTGIKFMGARKVEDTADGKKVPQAMALIDAAKYTVAIKYEDTSSLEEEIQKLLKQDKWETLKKSKSGEKIVDIKELVKDFRYNINENNLEIDCLVACGSRANLSADLLAQFIKANTSNAKVDAFVDIKREELYVKKGRELVPIIDFV